MPGGTRRYRSPRRAQQAAQTRADVVLAAAALFGELGWARTTIAAVAQRSGVSAETVYKLFASKARLLKATMDFTLVGDDQAVPLAERPAFKRIAIAHPSATRHMPSACSQPTSINAAPGCGERSSRQHPEIARSKPFAGSSSANADVTSIRSWSSFSGNVATDATARAVWLLGGPDSYIKLTTDGGLDRDAYVSTLTEALVRVLGQRPPRSPVRGTKASKSPRAQKRSSEQRP